MNVDEAYELHTDVARALGDDDSGTRRCLTQIAARFGVGEMQGMRVLADRDHLTSLRNSGVETMNVHTILTITDDTELPTPSGEVGVEDPEVDPTPEEGPEGERVADAALMARDLFIGSAVRAIAHAPTFYVTHDMCALLDHAARSLDETDVMPWHPQHPSGFVVLAEPMRLPFADGTEQIVSAFAWHAITEVRTVLGTSGLVGPVIQFVDRVRFPTEKMASGGRDLFDSKTAWSKSPRLLPSMIDEYVVGAPVGGVTEGIDVDRLRATRKQAMMSEAESQSATAQAAAGGVVGRFQPYLAAFLLLLDQQITAPTRRSATAGPVRRGTRAGRTQHVVTTVDLRHREHAGEPGEPGASGRHFSYRHLVGGHWKWQPYGPEHRLRRRIYVSGYVRGPEDTPLVVKPRVRRL